MNNEVTRVLFYSEPRGGDGRLYQQFPPSNDPEITRGINPEESAREYCEADAWAIPIDHNGRTVGHGIEMNRQKYPQIPNGYVGAKSTSAAEVGDRLATWLEGYVGVSGLTIVICSQSPEQQANR